MAIKIKKKSHGLDEYNSKIKIARASSSKGSITTESKSSGIKVGYTPGKSPKTENNFSSKVKNNNMKNSPGKIFTSDTHAFKLSIAPNMKKINVKNLNSGLINEYDRIAEEFKNKEIDNERYDQNKYYFYSDGKLLEKSFKDISKEERHKITKNLNTLAKDEGQKCKDEGKLFKFDEKSIVRVDGVITFTEDQLELQGASKKFILDAREEWIKETVESINKVYGKTDPVICRLHLDETNPHIHYSVIPRLQKEKMIKTKRRDGSTYDKVIQKGTIGSKHIIDPEFLSESLSNEMRKRFEKSSKLKQIDWKKLNIDELKEARVQKGLKDHVSDLTSFKTTTAKEQQTQVQEAKQMLDEIKNIKPEDKEQEIFRLERAKQLLIKEQQKAQQDLLQKQERSKNGKK